MPPEELLNVYDAEGRVVGERPRRAAKSSGLAVGAVNALLINRRGEVLLQRRPHDKENGGLWDKSVGGHVSGGEDFDRTLVREMGEELFDDPASPRVRLAGSEEAFAAALAAEDLTACALVRRVALQRNLRDIRYAPGGAGLRTVLYHVAIYAGRTDIPLSAFTPQRSEIVDLKYFPAPRVDRMLAERELAPNMAYLWLTQAHALIGLAARR
jgi:hypothetical protein